MDSNDKISKGNLRIVFMGTPEFAVETLRRLVEGGYQVVAVVTQPDKPVGRHQEVLQPSQVKQYAVAQGIPVLQPVKMKDEAFVEELASYKADLQVVVAFRMLPEVVWSMPRLGSFNVHAALLPQYRGAAPINWAVINGETKTGVTTFFLDKDIDTGRIIMQKEFDVPDDADVEYVYDGLMHLGADLCIETIEKIIDCNGKVQSIEQEAWPQSGKLHAAPKIFKDTCRINWQQTAKQVYDFIRGLSPYPAAWSNLDDGQKALQLKIYKARKTDEACSEQPGTIQVRRAQLFIATTDRWLELTELQLAGKKRMAAKAFLNGMHDIENYTII